MQTANKTTDSENLLLLLRALRKNRRSVRLSSVERKSIELFPPTNQSTLSLWLPKRTSSQLEACNLEVLPPLQSFAINHSARGRAGPWPAFPRDSGSRAHSS